MRSRCESNELCPKQRPGSQLRFRRTRGGRSNDITARYVPTYGIVIPGKTRSTRDNARRSHGGLQRIGRIKSRAPRRGSRGAERVPFPQGERVELNAGERKNDRVMTAPGPNGGCGVPARVREGQRRDRVITHRPIAVPRAAIMVRRGDVQSRAALRHPLRIHLAGTRDALVSRTNTWSRYSRLS